MAFTNLVTLQNYWREDENIWRSVSDKVYLQCLPRLYNEKAKNTFINNQIIKNPKIDLNDIKVASDKNGESHLYIHFQDKNKNDHQYFIRYTKTATFLKDDEVLLYIDRRNADKYRKSDLICFIENNGEDRYLIDSKIIDYSIRNEKEQILLSEAKKLHLFKAHWFPSSKSQFTVETTEKNKKKIFLKATSKDRQNTLYKFDITNAAGHRDTSRAIKVYSTVSKNLASRASISELYKEVEKYLKINKSFEQFKAAASMAATSSIKKIRDFRENHKLPRTKTSFLKTGLYLFDKSISDKDILEYITSLENYSLRL